MKKIINLLSLAIVSIIITSSVASAVTMYAPDGRTEDVASDAVSEWKAVGWYDYPVVTVYAPDGRTQNIYTGALNEWKAVGWYDYPVNISTNNKTLVGIYVKNTSGNLNVRSLPRHDSQLAGRVYEHDKMIKYYGESSYGLGSDGKKHLWYKIVTKDGLTGWVRSDLVKYPNVDGIYNESDNDVAYYFMNSVDSLNVRSEPKHDSKLRGTVYSKDIKMASYAQMDGVAYGLGSDGKLHEWTYVIVNSQLQGWVRSDLLIDSIYFIC